MAPQRIAALQRVRHRLAAQLRHRRHQRVAQEEGGRVRTERRRVGRVHLDPGVRASGERRGRAVDDREHPGARLAEALRDARRAGRVAPDAEGQQHVVRGDPQQLVGRGGRARAQLLHPWPAHVEVQGQPAGDGGAVELGEDEHAALGLGEPRGDGLEGDAVEPVARRGQVALVVGRRVVHALAQAAPGAQRGRRPLAGRLQQRGDLLARLLLRLRIALVAELGEQPHHGRGAGAGARRQCGGGVEERVGPTVGQGLCEAAFAAGEGGPVARQAFGQQPVLQ